MKYKIKSLPRETILTLAALSLSCSLQAQDITGSTSSTSTWVGTPSVTTGPAPTTGNGGTTQDNDNWGGNANGTGGFGALGQSFELSSSGTLNNIQMVLNGAAATFNVELYDLGAYPSGYPTTPQQVNALGSSEVNLLQPGDSFTFNGTSNPTLETLTFGGADANIQLASGELYMISLDPTGANADGIWWQRGGVPTAGPYNTGLGYNADGVDGMQNFEGKTGGPSNVRDFDTGVTVTSAVPEPSVTALISLTMVGWTALRRRK